MVLGTLNPGAPQTRSKEMESTCEKPQVKLVGCSGNAFAILGACQKAAQKAKWANAKIAAVLDEMMAGDYDNLLRKAMEHFEVT